MRRLGVATGLVAANTAIQTREVISIKGRVKDRLAKTSFEKDKAVAVSKLRARFEKHRHPAPMNRKEEMEHLTYGPEFEETHDLQRAADDLLAHYSFPKEMITEVAYHYHKTWKILTFSKTGTLTSNMMGYNKVAPP